LTAHPIKKLHLTAGQSFGPLSGLGPLDNGAHGAMRLVTGLRLDLPIAMPTPFLWELQLTSTAELPPLQVTLAGDETPLALLCRPGLRADVMGAVHPRSGRSRRKLGFIFGPDAAQGQIWFLGLTLLPLGDWLHP
jgi:hypothetical protein